MNVVVGLLLAALMVLPCVVTVASLAGRPWWPVGDLASIDLRVRNVWSLHPPLTGLYTRPGWAHPGPLMFWLMSLISAPAGGAAWATRIGGAVLQGVALAWLAGLAWRRGVRILLAVAAVTAATYFSAGSRLVLVPWNPHVPAGVFILFLFVTSFVANGSFRLLIVMVAAGSFVVQTHVSYTPLVMAGFVWAIGCTLIDARRQHRAPLRWRSTLLATSGVALMCWIGPVIDVVVHWPGNLSRIVLYFAGGEHTVGSRSAARIMASEFHPFPPWAGGHEAVRPFSSNLIGDTPWWLLVPIALLAGGGLAARASGSRDDGRLVALAALMLIVGTVGVSRADEPAGYHFLWRVVIAAFVVVASLWSVSTFVAPRFPGALVHACFILVLGGVAWGLIAVAVAVPSASSDTLSPAMRRIAQQVEHGGVPHGPILVRHTGEPLASIFHGLIDQLDRQGVDVRIDTALRRRLGYERAITPAHAHALWYVTQHGAYLGALLRTPGSHLIASTSPLAPTREAELSRLQAQLWDQLRRAGRTDLVDWLDSPFIDFKLAQVVGVDRRAVFRIGQLVGEVTRSGSCRCGVVSLPANAAYPVVGVPIQG